MQPLKQLSQTNLWAIEVPKDASNIQVYNAEYYSKLVFSSKINDPFELGGDMIIIPKGNYEILGFATKDNISFDVEPYVEKWDSVANDGTKVYENYNGTVPKCRTAIKSFYSRLKANGFDLNLVKKVLILK